MTTSCIPHSPASQPLHMRWPAALITRYACLHFMITLGPRHQPAEPVLTRARTLHTHTQQMGIHVMLSEFAERSDSCDPKWASTSRRRKQTARQDDAKSTAPKQRAEEGKSAPQPQPSHRERKRQREGALKGESERQPLGDASSTDGKTSVVAAKKRRTKGNNWVGSSSLSCSSSQRKRRVQSRQGQEKSDNANGIVVTAVDTQSRSVKITARASRQRRATSGAAQRKPRRSRRVPKEEGQFVGGAEQRSGAQRATERAPTTTTTTRTTVRTEAETGPRRGDEGTSSIEVMVTAAAAVTMPRPLHPNQTRRDMVPDHTLRAPLCEGIVTPVEVPTTPAGVCRAASDGCQLREDGSHPHHEVVDHHPLRVPLGGWPRRLLIFPLLHTPHLQPQDDQLGCGGGGGWPPRFATNQRRAVGSLLSAPPPPPSPPAQAVPWYSRLIDDGSTSRPRPSSHPPRPVHHYLPSSRVPLVPWQQPLVLSSPSELFSQDERPAASTLPFFGAAAAGGWVVINGRGYWRLMARYSSLSLSFHRRRSPRGLLDRTSGPASACTRALQRWTIALRHGLASLLYPDQPTEPPNVHPNNPPLLLRTHVLALSSCLPRVTLSSLLGHCLRSMRRN